jgi:hypothetical protein
MRLNGGLCSGYPPGMIFEQQPGPASKPPCRNRSCPASATRRFARSRIVARDGVVAVLGGCAFNLSVRRSSRIHRSVRQGPRRPVPTPDRIAGRRNHGRIVGLGCCQASQRPVRLLGMAFSATPALLQNLHLARVRQGQVVCQSDHRRVSRPEDRGYVPRDRPAPKARLAMALYVASWRRGM